jgi:hypothetical protein
MRLRQLRLATLLRLQSRTLTLTSKSIVHDLIVFMRKRPHRRQVGGVFLGADRPLGMIGLVNDPVDNVCSQSIDVVGVFHIIRF